MSKPSHTISCCCHSQSQLPSKTPLNHNPSSIKNQNKYPFTHLIYALLLSFFHLPNPIHSSILLSIYLLPYPHPYISLPMPTSHLTLIHPLNPSMDWFSWLSRTNLHPSLIYDYGVLFARNELQLEDSSFFNHEFLQSMGISIAKHRLEILKLAHKERGTLRPKKLSGVFKNCLRKCVRKLVFREGNNDSVKEVPRDPNWYYQEKWRGSMVRKQGSEELQKENNKPMNRSRTIALSGPLDGRMTEKMATSKVLRLSGPLDGRMMHSNRSPLVTRPVMGSVKSPRTSGPLDPRMVMVDSRSPRRSRASDVRAESPMGLSPYVSKAQGDFDYDDDDHTLWPTLFQDLKPT